MFDEQKKKKKFETGTTGKTVAIIVGGTAGVGFLVICLLFVKNLMKKKYDGTFNSSFTYMYKNIYTYTYKDML